MSASISITFAMEAGRASRVGAAGVGADCGAGSEAAKAAAIVVAIALDFLKDKIEKTIDALIITFFF